MAASEIRCYNRAGATNAGYSMQYIELIFIEMWFLNRFRFIHLLSSTTTTNILIDRYIYLSTWKQKTAYLFIYTFLAQQQQRRQKKNPLDLFSTTWFPDPIRKHVKLWKRTNENKEPVHSDHSIALCVHLQSSLQCKMHTKLLINGP